MSNVLVLNSDYNCINSITWKRAYNLVTQGKVEVVEYSDKIVQNFEGTRQFKVPAVIRLLRFIKSIYRAKVPFNKRNVVARDYGTCQYCSINSGKMTIDHVVPLSRGGSSTWVNCVASCGKCNSKKANMLLTEINMQLKRVPFEPSITQFLKSKFNTFSIDKLFKN